MHQAENKIDVFHYQNLCKNLKETSDVIRDAKATDEIVKDNQRLGIKCLAPCFTYTKCPINVYGIN